MKWHNRKSNFSTVLLLWDLIVHRFPDPLNAFCSPSYPRSSALYAFLRPLCLLTRHLSLPFDILLGPCDSCSVGFCFLTRASAKLCYVVVCMFNAALKVPPRLVDITASVCHFALCYLQALFLHVLVPFCSGL